MSNLIPETFATISSIAGEILQSTVDQKACNTVYKNLFLNFYTAEQQISQKSRKTCKRKLIKLMAENKSSKEVF